MMKNLAGKTTFDMTVDAQMKTCSTNDSIKGVQNRTAMTQHNGGIIFCFKSYFELA
jgi:hypothetical protein